MVMANRRRVSEALDHLRDGLGPMCEETWQRFHGEDWLRIVNEQLRHSHDSPTIEDVAFLLKGIKATWPEVFEHSYSRSIRALVFDVADVRNTWAHQGTFSADDAMRALDCMERLLDAFDNAVERSTIRDLRLDLMRLAIAEEDALEANLASATVAMEPDAVEPDAVEPDAVEPDAASFVPPRLSPSGVGMFEQCQRRWRFRYVDRLPDPSGEAALIGTFAHRVLEVLMQRPPAERTEETAKQLAGQEWPTVEADDDYQSLGLDAEKIKAFRWKAWLAIRGLWTLEDPQAITVRSTEQAVEAELGGVPFRGIVDRLDETSDGLVVTDYKTGKVPHPRYRQKRFEQAVMYAAAINESTGEMPVRVQLLYLGQENLGLNINQAKLDATVHRLGGTWAAINTACEVDEFDPSPGPLCNWCSYLDHCAEGTEEVARRAASKRSSRPR